MRYGDDEVRGGGQNNNDYMRASSSTSNVAIPAKAPTVPPPPTHRIPPLEVQRAREEARRILQARLRQEDELESESTDSGEYTIRDGSHPSSGDYQANTFTQDSAPPTFEMQEVRSGGSSGGSTTAAAVLSTAVLASQVGEADEIRDSSIVVALPT